jgi:hypothetical protein
LKSQSKLQQPAIATSILNRKAAYSQGVALAKKQEQPASKPTKELAKQSSMSTQKQRMSLSKFKSWLIAAIDTN